MSRIGLLFALAVAATVGLLFGLWPDLDLAISGLFFDPAQNAFPLRSSTTIQAQRRIAEWILVLLIAPAIIALAAKIVFPRRSILMSGRAALFLVATLALGPGLLVNAILKEQWSRPRPVAVAEFAGPSRFVAWWDPRGECRRNCSFVSGEASSAFWTLAPAALAPPPWRALALAAALAYGTGMSGLRVAVGAHFFTDVVFAAVFTFLIVWLVYGLIFRWPAMQSASDAVERAMERATSPVRSAVSSTFAAVAAAWKRLGRRAPGR